MRALALALLLAAGCAGRSQPPPPVIEDQPVDLQARNVPPPEPADAPHATPGEGATDSAPSPLPVATPPAGGQPDIKLLDPGQEPRRVIRHSFKKGTAQKLSMTSATRVSGASLPLPSMSLDAPIVAKILEINSDGDARFTYTAGPFKTQTSGGSPMGALLGGGGQGSMPEKVAGWGWITPQGVVREQHVTEGAKDGDAPMETGDPFPADPIGTGARWEVRTLVTEKGEQFIQTSSYELLSFDGKTAKTKLQRVQQPLGDSPDPIAESSGELVYKLGQVYPTGTLSMQRAIQIAIPGADKLGLKMNSEVRIR
jgi:hypothetical protein